MSIRSAKREIEKELKMLEAEIQTLETKRARSQASLLEAVISRQEPSETELQYFRSYTAEINSKRDQLLDLQRKLKSM